MSVFWREISTCIQTVTVFISARPSSGCITGGEVTVLQNVTREGARLVLRRAAWRILAAKKRCVDGIGMDGPVFFDPENDD